MADEFGFDDAEFEDDELGFDSFNTVPGEPEGSRNPAKVTGRSVLEGMIGSATDNEMIKSKVKDALPDSIGENWETADELLDVAERSKDNLINPIRKEMVSFKRNVNKLTPLVTRYLGGTIGGKFDELTKTREEREDVDPNTQELTSTIAGIFNEDAQAKMAADNNKLVLDMMERQTDEDRFKMQMTTMHDMMSAVRRMDGYNRNINYAFQQKTLEYDIKRFHLLKQILDVNKTVGEKTVEHLASITHNTSLPELVKQQQSELFQQMFIEKWYGDTLDGVVGQGRTMLRRFGQNLMSRASATADSIVDSMRSVGDMAEMVGDMTEGMDDEEGAPTDHKQEVLKALAKQTGGGVVKQGMDSIIYELNDRMKDRDWYQNMVAQSDNLARNQNLFLKTFIDDFANADEGWRSRLAPMFKILQEELPENQRSLTSIGHLNSFKPTDPRQWDHAQRTAVLEVIPGWLERIHNLIAEILGRESTTGYDASSGGFIEKEEIKKGILDRITTDEERTEALEEVDNLIDTVAKDIQGVGQDERQLLREWIIREASTTSDLDVRKLQSADSFKDLNNYDEDLAERVSGGFKEAYNADTLYRINRQSLEERESNNHIRTLDKSFKKVVRKYSDDQEVINEMLTSGRRGYLREMGIIGADGEINDLAILQHKLGGISGSLDVTDQSRMAEIVDQVRNPPQEKIETPSIPFPHLPTPPFSGLDVPNSRIPSGTPPDDVREMETSEQLEEKVNINAPTWDNPIRINKDDLAGLVTENTFTTHLSKAVDSLVGIQNNTDKMVDLARGMGGTVNPINPKSVGAEDTGAVTDYLSGILSTLATMHAANCDYYQNVKEFELGRHTLSSKVSTLVSKTIEKVTGGLGYAANKVTNMFNFGNKSIAAIREGFGERFSFDAADVYIGDEKSPRLLAKDFRTKTMYLRRNGEILDAPVRRPEDIKYELVDANQNVIISQEEIDNGLVRINREGVMKKLGGTFGDMVKHGFNAVDGTVNLTKSGFGLLGKGFDMAKKSAKKLMDKFRDVYILDENGKPKLLATVADFKEGRLLVEVDGKFETIKGFSDIFKGNIYRRDENGEPYVVATMEDVKRGLVDVTGKAIEFSSGMIDKITKAAKGGITGLTSMVKMPFELFGNTWKAIKAKFESRMLDKLILNIPKDIMISANVVYLNDLKGKPDPRVTTSRTSDPADKTVGERVSEKMAEARESFTEKATKAKESLTEKAEQRYSKLKENGRVVRAKAFMDDVAKDPKVLRDVVEKHWEETKSKIDTNVSKEEFIKNYLEERFGTKWEERLEDIRKVSKVENIKEFSNNIANSETVTNIKSRVDDSTNYIRDKLNIDNRVSKNDTVQSLMTKGQTISSFVNNKLMTNTLMRTNHQELIDKGDYKGAQAYLDKLKDNPKTLSSIINNEWNTHIKESDSPLSKEVFTKTWVKEKFGRDSKSVLQSLKETSENNVSTSVFEKIKSGMFKLKKPNANDVIDRGESKTPLKDLTEKAGDIQDISAKQREEIAKQHGRENGSGVGELVELMRNRFRSEKQKVLGDTDGDGIRENSWRDILNKRAEKKAAKKQLAKAAKAEKGSKDRGLIGLLLSGVGALISSIGSLTSGILGIGGTLLKGGLQLGKLVGSGIWSVIKPALGGLLKGGWKTLKAVNSIAGKAVGGALGIAKRAVVPVATKVGKKIAGKAAVVGARVLAGAALAATPVGWVIGAASIGWTAWEVSSAAWKFFDRRSDIKIIEYLRHMQYGMISGQNGGQHLNKISLRYFEGEIIGKATLKDDRITIGATTEEIWEEYRGDFEDAGDDGNKPYFVNWYENRFLPVLFKWMATCHRLNDAYKATQEKGFFGGKDDLSLSDMDSKLTPELKAAVARQTMNYGELDFDPLEIMDSPSTVVVTTVTREDCQAFSDKIIAYIKGKTIDGVKVQTPTKGKELSGVVPKAARTIENNKDKVDGEPQPKVTSTPSPLGLEKSDPAEAWTSKPPVDMGYLDFIKAKEGFRSKAFWDHKQYSIGYGTRTNDPAEKNGTKEITKEEAERRLVEYTNKDREYIVEKGKSEGLNWSQNELDALTSFTYNLGRGNLATLINDRTKEEIAEKMPLYSRASGKVLPGLLQRRQEEVHIFKKDGLEDKVEDVAPIATDISKPDEVAKVAKKTDEAKESGSIVKTVNPVVRQTEIVEDLSTTNVTNETNTDTTNTVSEENITNLRNVETVDKMIEEMAKSYKLSQETVEDVIYRSSGSKGDSDYIAENGRAGLMSLPKSLQTGDYMDEATNLAMGGKELQRLKVKHGGNEELAVAEYFGESLTTMAPATAKSIASPKTLNMTVEEVATTVPEKDRSRNRLASGYTLSKRTEGYSYLTTDPTSGALKPVIAKEVAQNPITPAGTILDPEMDRVVKEMPKPTAGNPAPMDIRTSEVHRELVTNSQTAQKEIVESMIKETAAVYKVPEQILRDIVYKGDGSNGNVNYIDNRGRYGLMSIPTRLQSGNYQNLETQIAIAGNEVSNLMSKHDGDTNAVYNDYFDIDSGQSTLTNNRVGGNTVRNNQTSSSRNVMNRFANNQTMSVAPSIKLPPKEVMTRNTSETLIKDKTTIATEPQIVIPEMPSNEGVETIIGEGNKIANDTLLEQMRNNDNIEELIRVLLAQKEEGSSETSIPEPMDLARNSRPAKVTTMPAVPPRVSTTSKYK